MVFTFSTRGHIPKFIDHRSFKKKLKSKNFNIIGELSCKGKSHSRPTERLFGGINIGHPSKKDLENARKFARDLVSTLN